MSTSTSHFPLASVFILCMLVSISAMSDEQQTFQDILVAQPRVASDLYRVTIDNQPVHVQRNDGREGPLSYVHVMGSGTARVRVNVNQPTENWTFLCNGEVIDPATGAETATFELSAGRDMILETDHQERLYLLLHKPDGNAPDPRDEDVLTLTPVRQAEGMNDGLHTAMLQQAIDKAAERPGGGTVVLTPGVYRSGTLYMRDNVNLYLAAGALLQSSTDMKHLPADPGTTFTPDRTQDISTRLILFDNVSNATLRGRGEIDGMGQILRVEQHRVPNIVRVRRSRNIMIEGVTLRRASGWNTHIFHSEQVLVRGVNILANWSDGIGVDNSRHVMVESVLSASYDDSFTVKATWFDEIAQRVEDILLHDALLWTDKAAIKIGTETRADRMGGFMVKNVTIAGGREALTIRCYDNAVVDDLHYRNVHVHAAPHCNHIVLFDMQDRHGKGAVRNVHIDNLTTDGVRDSVMNGLEAGHTISDVTFTNFMLDGKHVKNAEEARLHTNEWVRDITFR